MGKAQQRTDMQLRLSLWRPGCELYREVLREEIFGKLELGRDSHWIRMLPFLFRSDEPSAERREERVQNKIQLLWVSTVIR